MTAVVILCPSYFAQGGSEQQAKVTTALCSHNSEDGGAGCEITKSPIGCCPVFCFVEMGLSVAK